MRRLRFIPACLAIFLCSCSESVLTNGGDKSEMGEVSLELTSDGRHNIVVTKAEEEVKVDSFWVEIFNSKEVRLYRQKYADTKDRFLRFNAGDFTLLAKYGDSLGVGFDKPFYMAKQPFTIHPQTKENVSAVATLGNVKANVNFSENLSTYYSDFYAILKHKEGSRVKRNLKFTGEDEGRDGYIPADSLVFEVYADFGDNDWRYYALPAELYSPNDFITFNVDASERFGNLTVNVKIDNSLDVREKNYSVPFHAAPQGKPSVSLKGFDRNNSSYVYEKTIASYQGQAFSFNAKAGLSSCIMNISSEYLKSIGVPAIVDFANLDTETTRLLKAAGFKWAMTDFLGIVDLSGVLPQIGFNAVYNGQETVCATFSMTVEDVAGKSVVSDNAKLVVWPNVKGRISIEDYNVWATKIVDPQVSLTSGNASLCKIQYSADGGKTWTDAKNESVSASDINVEDIVSLTPDTDYSFRILYDELYPTEVLAVYRTEDDVQIPNSGFEKWHTETFEYYQEKVTLGIGDTYARRDWYLPWTKEASGTECAPSDEDSWWAVNSKRTMPSVTTPDFVINIPIVGEYNTGNTQKFKVFPCASYSTDAASGSRSAQMIGTFVCNMATANTDGDSGIWGLFSGVKQADASAAGEIFIGKALETGYHAHDGHTFPSRPTALKFKYKYSSYDSEKFHVVISVYDENGNVIGTKEVTDGPAASEWTEYTATLDYPVVNKKASRIYISFRSASVADNKVAHGHNRGAEMAGLSVEGHIGSILKIDDLELLY